jgi:2',3'-cyclic-nucleotide 2'-phosphodiesterase
VKIAFFGDVVGRPGREILANNLQQIRQQLGLDFVCVNGENSAGGFGITEAIANEIFDAGADCITLGNHEWDQREALSFIERETRLLRVCNYPALTNPPGRGAQMFNVGGYNILVISVMGRLYMDSLDCPYSALDREISACPLREMADIIIVDVHAEASGEKQGIGHFLDGRVSLVVGTHTHVPTADHRILEHGTGYITDLGMCGDYNSVLGMNKHISVRRQSIRLPHQRHEPATGRGMACGVYAEINEKTGLCTRIEPLRFGLGLVETIPQ